LKERKEKMEEGEELRDLKKSAAKALTVLRRKGSFEIVLSQHLTTAIPIDPLVKVRLICEAAFMISPDKLKETSIDMELVKTIYELCLSFLYVDIHSPFIQIPWSFPRTEEAYQKYIAPWHNNRIPLSFRYSTTSEKEKKKERIKQCESEIEEFFLLTNYLNLAEGSFINLKVEFLNWAIPKIMQVAEQISELIDPKLYKELLAGAKASEAGRKHEDSMG